MSDQHKTIIIVMMIILFVGVTTLTIYSGLQKSSASQMVQLGNINTATPNITANSTIIPEPTNKPTSRTTQPPSFTNEFGTLTTICNHSGCSNYIARSGDTNCCTMHSQRCLECGCYIDEDALWCMDCLMNALDD